MVIKHASVFNTQFIFIFIRCGYSSVVEHLVANENVARSNRVTRLFFLLLPI